MMARFFNILLQGFDWEGLDNRTLDPPITPKVLIREEETIMKENLNLRQQERASRLPHA